MISCDICQAGDRKYKCPSCKIPYCSVQCYQTHKDSNACTTITQAIVADTSESQQDTDSAVEVESTYQFPTQHTVPLEKLQLLGTNKSLKSLLANPHLQTMLTALTRTKNIHHAMNMVMLEPIFVEFAVECLKTVESKEGDGGEEDEELKKFVTDIKKLVDFAEQR